MDSTAKRSQAMIEEACARMNCIPEYTSLGRRTVHGEDRRVVGFRRDLDAELAQLALDAPVSPGRVLGRDPQDQRGVGSGMWRRGTMRCFRCHLRRRVAASAERVRRDEHRAVHERGEPASTVRTNVLRSEARAWDLTLQDVEVLTEHEEFQVLGP